MNPDCLCVAAEDPLDSGAAAIATIARFHGCELKPSHLMSIAAVDTLHFDLLLLLMAAKACGFTAVPLEGSFEELPEVPRPNIVVLADETGHDQFAVLFEIDADSVLIGDTSTGEVATLAREQFCDRWTGDAVLIEAGAEELETLRARLSELDDPWFRLRSLLSWEPPYPPKIAFSIATIVVLTLIAMGAAADPSPAELSTVSAIALCLLSSMWLGAFSSSCAECAIAGKLVGGMPVAKIGVLFYSALLIGALTSFGHPLLALALAAATGSHFVLVGLLFKHRVLCWGCGITAVSALAAMAIAAKAASLPIAWLLVTITSMAIVSALAIPMAQNRSHVVSTAAALDLATAVVLEKERPQPGRARIVVYKKKDCPICAYVEGIVSPALEQDFGEALDIEERWVRKEKTFVPLIIVQGSSDFVLFGISMEGGYQQLQMTVRAALDPELGGLAALGGLTVVGTDN